jgi:hypothetical protein
VIELKEGETQQLQSRFRVTEGKTPGARSACESGG